ncbi:MAG: class I SAM-dependent methyltransferase [Ornithinimicrobium sp.]
MSNTAIERPEDAAARLAFWEQVHAGHDVDGVSWWQSVPGLSLGLVDETEVPKERSIIDVGAGWSTLVDHLLERGYTDLTAVDLSKSALQEVRERLGPDGDDVVLDIEDVLEMRRTRRYALWHDRAV